jgi:hypothetical protein
VKDAWPYVGFREMLRQIERMSIEYDEVTVFRNCSDVLHIWIKSDKCNAREFMIEKINDKDFLSLL